MLGVELLLKEGLKIIGTYTAKNLARRSIDLGRRGYGIGAKKILVHCVELLKERDFIL
jgi:hypothetical protein